MGFSIGLRPKISFLLLKLGILVDILIFQMLNLQIEITQNGKFGEENQKIILLKPSLLVSWVVVVVVVPLTVPNRSRPIMPC